LYLDGGLLPPTTGGRPMTSTVQQMQRAIAETATQQGISLRQEFGTTERFAEFVIGMTFKVMTDNGMSVEAATDAIFGDGAYERIAAEVWELAQS
jgi:hypothetical protein